MANVSNLQLQALEHELHHCRPVVEAQIPCQGSDVIKEGGSARKGLSNQPIAYVGQLQDRMEEKGQEVK
jgi:hypothetical protein